MEDNKKWYRDEINKMTQEKEQQEASVKSFGMLPNLHGVLSESPELLEAYKMLHDSFQKTSFNSEELTVVWQTINVEHECPLGATFRSHQ